MSATTTRSFNSLALTALLAVCQLAFGANADAKSKQAWLEKSQQLVVVRVADWQANTGTLQRFERTGDHWQAIAVPFAVSIGKNGSAWGMGLHPPQNTGPQKIEGDGKAPAGIFSIGTGFGYASALNTKLDYQAMTDTDWSVDRLNNQLGYVPGNLCIMSARVNRLKDASDVASIALQGTYKWLLAGDGDGLYQDVGFGLLAIEAMRLAALMQGPTHMRSGGFARFTPYAMAPSAWATFDGAIAGIHMECARSRVDEGFPYRRRRDLFKRLGKEHWSKSNRLVSLLRKMLANGKHPADVWFDDTPLDMLLELIEEFVSNPPPVDGTVDLEAVRQSIKAGLNPLAKFER